MHLIREAFTQTRPLDRRIEKVIDYAATDEERLDQEIAEYEVTPSVEAGIRRFVELYDEGVRLETVADIGIWVSGFYGSGKSSLTKYLGFSLDARRTIRGVPFVDRLADRIPDPSLRLLLKNTAKRHRTAVFMLDLATDQMAESASETVSNVLYWNVLRELGYSKEKKVANLEMRLERDKQLDAFRAAYGQRYPGKEPWDVIHNDPMLAVTRASTLVPTFYPDDFKDPRDFASLQYEPIEDVREVAARVVGLIRERRACDSIVFFVDEVGQYVGPRRELILNFDGLVKAFKEIGKGKVWLVATAQQTLTEISEKASLNSAELFKLKDRLPHAIQLEATDIREITARRLLQKNPEGEAELKRRFKASAEILSLHSHLVDWPGGSATLDADTFARLYPFLPARFDLVLDLIHALARRTGGTGLRSAIRIVQDLLVDANRTLPQGTAPLADRPLGRLATVEDVYDTLRRDIGKEFPQAVEGVDRIMKHASFKGDALAIRVAKAVAALQPLENRPRTARNIAALLYGEVGVPGQAEAVEETLNRLVDTQEFGLVELRAEVGATGGVGFLFLSDEVQPLQKKRDAYIPAQADLNGVRLDVLKLIFDPVPETRLEGVKVVQAGVRLGRSVVAGESNDVLFRLEEMEADAVAARLSAIETDSQNREDYANVVTWVFAKPVDVDERLVDICRSGFIQVEGGRTRDREKAVAADVSRYLRAEERRAERDRDAAKKSYDKALFKGSLVFRGMTRPAEELGTSVLAAATSFLAEAAQKVFCDFALVKKNLPSDTAAKFLGVERLDRMTKDRDPLGLVQTKAGRTSIDTGHPALGEALRAFRDKNTEAGSGRVQGSALLDLFNKPPYGWSKDTTRYLFAALLTAGEVEVHTGDSVIRTPGPKAVEAFKNTQSFGRVGLAQRGQPPPIEALDRASRRLEEMFAVEVLPLEDQVSRAVRTHFPGVLERTGSLPDRLRLLRLPGEERARSFLATCAILLKEDAAGATSLLGGTQCSLPEDVKWADGLTRALDAGGEKEIAEARRAIERARELATLFPTAEELGRHESLGTMDEVLSSESFHERLADLREAHRELSAHANSMLTTAQARLVSAVESARARLEARPSWRRIPEETRQESVDALLRALELPRAEDCFAPLQYVWTLLLNLPALELELATAADELAKALDAQESEDEPEVVVVVDRPRAVEAIPFTHLLPQAPLASAQDVEAWIEVLRSRLLERVQLGPIELTGDT
jgi:hypothetical protein